MSKESQHISVLLEESIAALNIKPNGTYIDGTMGAGGHAHEILKRLDDGQLLGFDLDPAALDIARERLSQFGDLAKLFNVSYADMNTVLTELGIDCVDGILLDLGYSSMQIDDPQRGFSFQHDGPLDMRFSPDHWVTAHEILQESSKPELVRIFKEFGEERWAAKIADAIVNQRIEKPIETTTELAELIKETIPKKAQFPKGKSKSTHPATKIFQALRIAVNDELENVRTGLVVSFESLCSGGRLAVITFHSLEDRIVKQYMRSLVDGCTCPPDLPVCGCGFRPLAKTLRDIAPSEAEIDANPRSRSARLRILEKL